LIDVCLWSRSAFRRRGVRATGAAFVAALLLFGCSRAQNTALQGSPSGSGGALISAAPNPVPAANETGITTIRWDTGNGSEGQVYVSDNGAAERLFAQAASGSQDAPWIGYGHTYEFRVYAGTARSTLLGSVSVTTERQPNSGIPTAWGVAVVGDAFLSSPLGTRLVVLIAALLGPLLLISAALAYRRGRLRTAAVLRAVLAALITLAATVAVLGAPMRPLADQPFPDAQEYADAAHQLAEGHGYVTLVHGNQPQPPRYPPGFSLALSPFAVSGQYPANVQLGSKLLVVVYLLSAVGVSWNLGGPLAAAVAAMAIGTSPFATTSASLVMSDAFAAALTVLLVGVLHHLSRARVVTVGVLAGALVLVRLNALFALAAYAATIPRRFWASLLLGIVPLLLAIGVYQWSTFGSPLKTGYDYWLPSLKTFDVSFALRANPQGDGPYIVADRFDGAVLRDLCSCPDLHPQGALPNLVFYPAVMFGLFWIFAPPLVGLLGLAYAWSRRREPAFSLILWLTLVGVLVQVFYFYQGARLIAVPATLLIVAGAVACGHGIQRGLGIKECVPMGLKLHIRFWKALPGGFALLGVLFMVGCDADQPPVSSARTAAAVRATTPTATSAPAVGIPPTLGATPPTGTSRTPTPELARTGEGPQAAVASGPGLTAAPNPVPVEGQVHGATTVAWTVDDPAGGEVYVATDGGPERLFASGAGGSQEAPWITAGTTYEFRLYRGADHQERLATLQVTSASPQPAANVQPEARSQPVLAAEPNPVPSTGPELATTTILWEVGDPQGAEVYVSADGGGEQLFVRGNRGSQPAAWICRGSTYVFHMYAGTDHRNQLAAITVTRGAADASQSVPDAVVCPRGTSG
jgi:hypothetical protein